MQQRRGGDLHHDAVAGQDAEGSRHASAGPLVCLADGITRPQWRWLRENWQAAYERRPGRVLGATVVWCEAPLEAEIADYPLRRVLTSHKIASELQRRGGPLQVVARIEHQDATRGCLLVPRPELLPPAELSRVLDYPHGPVVTIGPGGLYAEALARRFKRDRLREALNKLDAEYDVVRDNLLAEMTKHQVLTLKTENYTISRKNMKTIKVTNDAAVISELQNAGIQPPMIVKWNWRAMGQEAYKQIEIGNEDGVQDVPREKAWVVPWWPPADFRESRCFHHCRRRRKVRRVRKIKCLHTRG